MTKSHKVTYMYAWERRTLVVLIIIIMIDEKYLGTVHFNNWYNLIDHDFAKALTAGRTTLSGTNSTPAKISTQLSRTNVDLYLI
jgi:hypothetical protein